MQSGDVFRRNIIRFCKEGDLDAVKDCVKHDKLNSTTIDGYTTLDGAALEAAENGHLHIVKYLAENGADIHIYDDMGFITAVREGNLEMVKYFVDQGSNIRQNNDTALCIACFHGRAGVVRYLVEQGADIHAQNDYPIRGCFEYGESDCGYDMITYLMEKGVQLSSVFNSGQYFCIFEGASLKMVKFLTENNVDPRVENDFALGSASKDGKLDVVQYLVENTGADVTAENNFALRYAACHGHLEVVKYLIEKGANMKADTSHNAVRHAVEKNCVDMLKFLVENGADMDTLWMMNLASLRGYLKIVQYLLEQIKVAECDAATKEVIDSSTRNAAYRGHLDVVKYLIENGAEAEKDSLLYCMQKLHFNVSIYLAYKLKVSSGSFYGVMGFCASGYAHFYHFAVSFLIAFNKGKIELPGGIASHPYFDGNLAMVVLSYLS